MDGALSIHRGKIVKKILAVLFALQIALASAATAAPKHGLAMHGEPKYPAGFKHFDYVNPKAPKGGELKLGARDTFDTLNPYTLKGMAASNLSYTYDTLMIKSADEPFTLYGLVAESVETPQDRSWVVFRIRPEARFHDGKPITAEDVAFTLDILKNKGNPFYKIYYGSVSKSTVLDKRTVRFDFAPGENRELPMILGELPVLPKHYWEKRDFEKTTLEPPLTSGPYKIASVDPGRSITYERVKDWWAKDLNVSRGLHNFDRIRIDYYRDDTVSLEAFKAGEYDWRLETTAKLWATEYDFPAVKEGKVILAKIPHMQSTGMQGFMMNTRKALFRDVRVRKALSLAFNFELANRQLFHGQYSRTSSYYSNSELASSGLPTGRELEILEKYRSRLPPEVFTKEVKPSFYAEEQGSEDPWSKSTRANLREAAALLKEAGWNVGPDGKLTDGKGSKFAFEILLYNPAFERISLPYAKNLEKLGIDATVRTVDATQYENRMQDFDFDMTVYVFGQSQSPGNEQRDFFGSEAARTRGSRNVVGISDPVVDELIEGLISAPDRKELIARTKALDRVLLNGYYVVPHWHIRYHRVAWWNKFGKPPVDPPYDLPLEAWWSLSAGK